MRTSRLRLLAGLLATGLLVVAAGCSSTTTTATSTRADSAQAPIPVVTSTDVWGDIARAVGGDRIEVTSIITNPDADPHSYEASPATAVKLSRAAVVIENGGGYDDFMDTMLETSKNHDTTVLNAVGISGKQAASGAELNEHVWYDFPTVAKVADQFAAALGRVDTGGAAQFSANADAFEERLATLEKDEKAIARSAAGKGAAITEPVPLYMLTACGIVNKTPAEFSEAIEEGTDVSPRVLAQTLSLFSGHAVDALVYNEQTSGAVTEKVVAAAKRADVPIIPVRETLPAGKDYLTWMSDNLAAIRHVYGT